MTLEKDLTALQEERTDKLEERVTELERQIEVIRLALEIYKQWMETINEQSASDQKILERLNERISYLESRTGKWKY